MAANTAKASIMTFIVLIALAGGAVWFITSSPNSLSVGIMNNAGTNLYAVALSNNGQLLDEGDLGINQSKRLSLWSGEDIDMARQMVVRIVLRTDDDEVFAVRNMTGQELIDCGQMLEVSRNGNLRTRAQIEKRPVDM